MLKTEQNTEEVRKLVGCAAIKKFGTNIFKGTRKGQINFEHGQWWFQYIDNEGELVSYSVVDAYPGIGETGLDFEEL